ncbi:MAG TPA: hypothetical protein VFI25_14880 [Planctomycetota bacterium]|nr:hypothetical protein [Planctomycetota bacterium]
MSMPVPPGQEGTTVTTEHRAGRFATRDFEDGLATGAQLELGRFHRDRGNARPVGGNAGRLVPR